MCIFVCVSVVKTNVGMSRSLFELWVIIHCWVIPKPPKNGAQCLPRSIKGQDGVLRF